MVGQGVQGSIHNLCELPTSFESECAWHWLGVLGHMKVRDVALNQNIVVYSYEYNIILHQITSLSMEYKKPVTADVVQLF